MFSFSITDKRQC